MSKGGCNPITRGLHKRAERASPSRRMNLILLMCCNTAPTPALGGGARAATHHDGFALHIVTSRCRLTCLYNEACNESSRRAGPAGLSTRQAGSHILTDIECAWPCIPIIHPDSSLKHPNQHNFDLLRCTWRCRYALYASVIHHEVVLALPHISTRPKACSRLPTQQCSEIGEPRSTNHNKYCTHLEPLHELSSRASQQHSPCHMVSREASAFFLFGSQTGHLLRPASAKTVLCVMVARKGFPSVSSGQLQNIGRYSTTAPASLHYALSGRSTADFRVYCR